jgi:hypothetical protein
MNDLRFAVGQLLKNPASCRPRIASLARLPRPVSRRHFEPRDQHDVHNLIVIRAGVSVNEHFAAAGCQSGVVLVLHQQPATIRHMDDERPKWSAVKKFSDFVRFHATNPNSSPIPAKVETCLPIASQELAVPLTH